METYFVDVLLPLALPDTYTYRVPQEMNALIAPGKRVVVQFGQKRIYSAIVRNVHQTAPLAQNIKYILDIIDEKPVVTSLQFKFWDWISEYYMTTRGEVMSAALPTAMKLASESKIVLNPEFDGNTDSLNDKEYLIYEALETNGILTITEVSAIVELKKVVHLINGLYDKGVIRIEEELIDNFKPKTEPYVIINLDFTEEEKLRNILDSMEKKAPKQVDLLMAYLQMTNSLKSENLAVSKAALLKQSATSGAVLDALKEKGILQVFEKVISRIEVVTKKLDVESIKLSVHQQVAFESIKLKFETNNIQLLHGVTGSGKTEIYIKLINEVISTGKKVLFLLPEIALTAQIINRLRKYFGSDVGIYHSRYSQNERVEVWNNLVNKEKSFKIIIGARSSVFLPISNLGLVIIDEEHDTSYKQMDPAPRYNGRDAGIFLAGLNEAKCLLGSATPSIETYKKAKDGKYGLTTLTQRFGESQMPLIKVVDTIEATKKGNMKSHFSKDLIDEIDTTLKAKQQVILFRNRRGFSLSMVCEKCHWTPECKHCDVTLTFHKQYQKLKCHYCGYAINVPDKCPSCGSSRIKLQGFGTEKIENELPIFFNDAVVKRMDLDTTRGKNSYSQIINDFEDKKIDILVGTQMVTKGLDFENVGLVGVMSADSLISYPDFRSGERGFQMLTQVSGRAGRKGAKGKVIIQTSHPEHSIIQRVVSNDYTGMYESQIADRENFGYPPFTRLIKITLKHKDFHLLNEASRLYAERLRERLGGRVIGPEFPIVSRVKTLYLKNILVKIEMGASHRFVKNFIHETTANFEKKKEYRQVMIAYDVDPY